MLAPVSGDFDMSLFAAVRDMADTRYRTTKQEIYDYYQEEGLSQAQLGRDLSPYTFDKNGNPIKPRNLERDFNPDRLNKPVRTAAKKLAYEALGHTLPPIVTFNPFNVHFKGKIKISDKWKKCEFTVHVGRETMSFDGYHSLPEERDAFIEDGWEGWIFLTYMKGDPAVEDWEGTFDIY